MPFIFSLSFYKIYQISRNIIQISTLLNSSHFPRSETNPIQVVYKDLSHDEIWAIWLIEVRKLR